MPYAILEEEIKSLPASLQKNIESYILSVVEKNKRKVSAFKKSSSVSDILDELTGIISDAPKITAKEIRSMRLSENYGV